MSYRARAFNPARATLVAILVGVLIGMSTVGGTLVMGYHGSPAVSTSPSPPSPPPPSPPPPTSPHSIPSCLSTDAQVADPSAPHGEFVLDPPTEPHHAYYSDVQTYLLNNPILCGADFWVAWDTVDAGPQSHPEYNFSAVDAEAAPWIAAGKEVNLIFEMLGGSPSYVPASILSEVPTLQCGTSGATPVEWNATFETAYRAFLAATVQHFDSESGFGYLRFNLGVSGETSPISDINAPGCQSALMTAGFSLATWANYLTGMLSYEHSLDPSIGLITPVSPVFPGEGDNITATVSSAAAADGIGIGNQGLRANDSSVVEPNGVGCGGNGWCQQFWRFAGVVPLELQTAAASSPDGSGTVGSLVSLLPFALSQHTQVLELYLDDWLTAFDPNYPAYASYHTAYASALTQAAAVVGTDGG